MRAEKLSQTQKAAENFSPQIGGILMSSVRFCFAAIEFSRFTQRWPLRCGSERFQDEIKAINYNRPSCQLLIPLLLYGESEKLGS
jgi:hypothetical protein